MNNINANKIVLFIIGLVFGLIVSLQLKQNLSIFTPVTIKSIQESINEIKRIEMETDEINNLFESKKKYLYRLEIESNKTDAGLQDILLDDLVTSKAITGFEQVTGPGIVIRLEDNLEENVFGAEFGFDVIHDVDVLRIINDLRIAGAEAISINEERVLSTSGIKCAGPVIRINGRSVGTPFYIRAVGDKQLLNAAINAPNSYAYALVNVNQINIESYVEDKIVIPSHRDKNFVYAKPVEEGE